MTIETTDQPNTFDPLLTCIGAVKIAQRTIQQLGVEGRTSVETPKDIVTVADNEVKDEWKKYIASRNVPIKVLTEESEKDPFPEPKNPQYLGIGDEIDGTFNFYRAGSIFPHCSIFTLYDSLEPKYKDAIATAVLDHNTGNMWTAKRGKGCHFIKNTGKKTITVGGLTPAVSEQVSNERAYVSDKTTLDQDTSIIIDHGPCVTLETLIKFSKIRQNSWPRNISSAGIHFAGVASGKTNGFDGFISWGQKPEELAAGYLMVTEAGGYVYKVTDAGHLIPMGDELLDMKRTYKMIATGTNELAHRISVNIYSDKEAQVMASRAKGIL
ncbi:hypothetical protein GOV12_07840 [Candidatus Pacearchaeota archaeon]|nr:hypothetical protein [Candidatus Pacearchaeota archaeon]